MQLQINLCDEASWFHTYRLYTEIRGKELDFSPPDTRTYIIPVMRSCVVPLMCLFTRTYSCSTALWCRKKKTKISTIIFHPLLHIPHTLCLWAAVRFFTPDQVILYYILCFLGRQEGWDDGRSGSAAKSNSRVYLWTSVGRAGVVTPPKFTGDFH